MFEQCFPANFTLHLIKEKNKVLSKVEECWFSLSQLSTVMEGLQKVLLNKENWMHGDSERATLMKLDSSGTKSLTQHLSQVYNLHFFCLECFAQTGEVIEETSCYLGIYILVFKCSFLNGKHMWWVLFI